MSIKIGMQFAESEPEMECRLGRMEKEIKDAGSSASKMEQVG